MRKWSLEEFKKDAAECKELCDVDQLALAWLMIASIVQGRPGQNAHDLLKVVGDILDI